MLMPAGMVKKSSRTRSLKLAEITKPLITEEKSGLMLRATQRILNSEKAALNGGIPTTRTKIISSIGARFSATTKSAIGNFVLHRYRLQSPTFELPEFSVSINKFLWI